MVTKQMRSSRWNATGQQKLKLHQPCGAPIAITKGMYPGHVEVRNDRLQNPKRNFAIFIWKEALAVEPFDRALSADTHNPAGAPLGNARRQHRAPEFFLDRRLP